MTGIIFNVKRYAIHDGPGIRVTFFLKGCPMTCAWCHNPEGISSEPEEIIQINRIGKSEFSQKEKVGRSYSADEVLAIVEKDRIFLEKSGGGVTFSGGEPLMQAEFLKEVLVACRERGLHTAIDTSGQFAPEKLDQVLPFTDLFLFDLKHTDPEKHRDFTGVSNELILKNLERIIAGNSELIVRIPVIPDFNDDTVQITMMRELIRRYPKNRIKAISLLPYHKTGMAKYRKLNIPFRLGGIDQPSAAQMKEMKEFFSQTGIRVKVGG